MALPTSSATSSAPCLSMASPTGRPIAWPLSFTNPINTSTGSPAGEGYEHDLVATARDAVRRTMLPDEHPRFELDGQGGALGRGQPQRCGVGAQCVVGHRRSCHQCGVCRLWARVNVIAETAVRPTVEGTVFHRRHVVRHQIATQFVPLIRLGAYGRSRDFRSSLEASDTSLAFMR
jgi:hypothetical protein